MADRDHAEGTAIGLDGAEFGFTLEKVVDAAKPQLAKAKESAA
jgi:hypothetical protein